MQETNNERLVIVQNPNSTNHRHVEERVLQPLQHAGIDYEVYTTQYPDGKKNVADMIERLPENARVISAAGDGTAEQVVNAMITRGSKNSIGILPFGNFNDMAYAHMDHSQNVLDFLDAPTTEVTPLIVEVNGKPWRHVPGYITMGLTARVAAGFDDAVSRETMRGLPKPVRLIRRLGQAASDYFRYKNEKIAPFRVNGGQRMEEVTDIAVANNPVVAGMIRTKEPFYDSDYFGVKANINLADIPSAAAFGLKSLVGKSPLERMTEMRIEFEKAAQVHIQTEGEYDVLEGVESIFIYKDPSTKINILHPKQS